jgi:hypothetical protein
VYAEDAAHSSGDGGIMILGIRSGGSDTYAGTNGDYSPIAVSSTGYVFTTDSKALNNGAASASTLRVTVASDSLGQNNPKANATVISQTTAVTLGGGVANDARLMAIHIGTALTGTCVISGFADGAAAAQSYTFPASTVGTFNFFGAVNSAGALTVTCSNAADDNKVIVMWAANV